MVSIASFCPWEHEIGGCPDPCVCSCIFCKTGISAGSHNGFKKYLGWVKATRPARARNRLFDWPLPAYRQPVAMEKREPTVPSANRRSKPSSSLGHSDYAGNEGQMNMNKHGETGGRKP